VNDDQPWDQRPTIDNARMLERDAERRAKIHGLNPQVVAMLHAAATYRMAFKLHAIVREKSDAW